ncbi:serine/threonine protein kinase [Stieleria sp. JC731]|uniref:serine/threonine protein kinase n=1 Tax=Pirellulaceae TaxID=2691357 RepID=UPI001E4A56A2|nr:serine/threonine protein kinase [Stieleria sp. JC731]MCC9601800.1 serine/threonine protein kinase [Stieleria sp. JC731]
MDVERYAKVRTLFLAVEAMEPEQQRAYLEKECDQDSELLGEVLSLLDEHDVESARLEGNSAKQPALPSGERSGDSLDASDVSGSIPFMPNARDHAVGNPSDQPRSPRQFNRRKRDLPSKSATAKVADAGEKEKAHASQITMQGAQRTHASPRYSNDSAPPQRPPSPGLWQSRAKKHRRFNSGWLWLAAILPTVLVGAWTYTTVVKSLRQSTEQELDGVADSISLTVKRYLDDQARLARSWSQQVDLRQSIIALIETTRSDESIDLLRDSPHALEIRSQLKALSQLQEIKYFVWDRTGRIVASWREDGSDLGEHIPPENASYLARSMRGETVLFGPEWMTEESSLGDQHDDQPVMAEMLPIRDSQSRIIATILIGGFGMFENFDKIFHQASQSGGLDVYAVNSQGNMITNSTQAIAELLGDGDKNKSREIAGQLRVSDPTDSGQSSAVSLESRRSQPLTYAVSGVSNGNSDSMLTPYSNYSGTSVVGAWRWIDDYDIGIVVEQSSDFAFATARIVRYGFFSLGCMLTLTALVAASVIAKRTALAQAAVHPLSRYEIVSELGSGGMGVVYRAKHAQLGRDTALKVLRADRDNLEDRLRFDREAKLAASLSSAHTVTIYDYGRGEEGEAYCVMEFLKGITLYDAVARSGYQEIGRVLYILRQICDSLGEAHNLGLVHRDMKPQNVMLSIDPSVGDWAVVFDFGLAKPLHSASDAYQTSETIWAGTPMYMAPERYREPNKIDPRSDIYSVGCIAYFLLSGRPPFIECDPESLFALVLTEDPISIAVHRDEDVPEKVAAFVKRCMAKNMDERFGSIDELAKQLDELIREYPWSVEQSRAWWRIHGDDLD